MTMPGAWCCRRGFPAGRSHLRSVLLDEPSAYLLFLVAVCIARAARGGASVEHHRSAPVRLQAGEDVLQPAPVGLAAGVARAFGKAVKLVSVVVLFLELRLVPHRIGDNPIKCLEAIALAELRLAECIADLNLALHVVDDHVHVGHSPGARLVLLAIELQRRVLFFLRGRHFFIQHEIALNEQTGGATAGVVDVHARLRVHDAGDDEADLSRRVEFAGALSAAFGELADQVFVAAADDVGLDVVETETLRADLLDEIREAVVVDVALAVGRGIEVDPVDDALEQRVRVGDGAQVRRKLFADLVGQRADDRPDGIVRVLRLQRQVEAHKLLVVLDQLERLGARTDFLGDAVQLVIEYVAEPLGKDEREDEFLVLRSVLRTTDRAGGVPNPGLKRFVGFGRGLLRHCGAARSILRRARFL